MTEPAKCLTCGSPLDEKQGGTLCPACMMRSFLKPEAAAESVRREALDLPRRFGDYELLEEIGRGGMGVVFRARQLTLDRTVAVKLLLTGGYSSELTLHRFRTEAEAAAGLRHPNIVAIHDFGEVEGEPYYAMDLVEGRNLATLCDWRPLAPRRAAEMLRQLAEAAHHAHQRGVLHRDLKPSNVIIDESDRPLIADFGLAKLLDVPAGVTLTSQALGSPGYMAPEQARGRAAEIGPATDVYGLGALFFHLLTGRAPYNAATPVQTMKLVLESDPPAPRLLNPALPPELETICLKCLEREPGRRYAAASEVGDDVDRYLAGRPIRARPPSVAYRFRKYAQRHWIGMAAAAGIVLALTVGLILALAGYRSAVEQQREADAARGRSQEVVSSILEDLHPQLLETGRREAVITSAKAAVDYFEKLPARLHDVESMRAHAKALTLLANVYGNAPRYWAITNITPENREISLKAVELWREVARAAPDDPEAMAMVLLGEWILARENSGGQGIDHSELLQSLRDRLEDLEHRFPGNRSVWMAQSIILHFQIANHKRHGRPEQAAATAREAHRLSELQLAKNPDDIELLLTQAVVLGNLATAYWGTERHETGLRHVEDALAIAERLLASDPYDLRFLTLAANRAMTLITRVTSAKQRLEWLKVAIPYVHRLWNLDPSDPKWRQTNAFLNFTEAHWMGLDRRVEVEQTMTAIHEALDHLASVPTSDGDPGLLWHALALAGEFAATQAGDAQRAGDYLEQLRREPVIHADGGGSTNPPPTLRFSWLHNQSVIVQALEDWVELERLAREMLAQVNERMLEDEAEFPPSDFRAPAEAALGSALLMQGRTNEGLPFLKHAVKRFRESGGSGAKAAERLGIALQEIGSQKEAVEVLEWAHSQRVQKVERGTFVAVQIDAARGAWWLAQALDASDPEQEARQRELMEYALELLSDPEVEPRLKPDEQQLRAQIVKALDGVSLTQKGGP